MTKNVSFLRQRYFCSGVCLLIFLCCFCVRCRSWTNTLPLCLRRARRPRWTRVWASWTSWWCRVFLCYWWMRWRRKTWWLLKTWGTDGAHTWARKWSVSFRTCELYTYTVVKISNEHIIHFLRKTKGAFFYRVLVTTKEIHLCKENKTN